MKKKKGTKRKQTNKRRSERKNFNVAIKAATNLIPFSCMLKTFYSMKIQCFYCGRGMSLRVQMIQDLSTIKTLCTTLPHQTTAPSKLNPKIPQRRNGNKTGFGCSFPLVTSSDRRNRWCNRLRTRRLQEGKCIRNLNLSF